MINLENESKKLKAIAEEKNEIIIKQSHKVTEAEHEIANLNNSISELKENETELINTNKYLNQKLEENKNEIALLISEKDEFNILISNKDKKISEQDSEIRNLNVKISDLSTTIKDLKDKAELQENDLKQAKDTELNLRRNLDDKEKEISTLKSRIAEFKT